MAGGTVPSDERLQQHDRQQRVDPRGRRHRLDDAPNVRIFNNTIMKNLTTATAVTSDGQPAPAGLSTSPNSDQLQATLPAGSPHVQQPVLFNNIFWDNRAGTRAGHHGHRHRPGRRRHPDQPLGPRGRPTAPACSRRPTRSSSRTPASTRTPPSPTNSAADPAVVDAVRPLGVASPTWRQNPAFVDATLVAVEAPPDQLGDYHLSGCPASPACNLGAASKAVPSTSAAGDLAPRARHRRPGPPGPRWLRRGRRRVRRAAAAAATQHRDLYFSTVGNTNPPGVAAPRRRRHLPLERHRVQPRDRRPTRAVQPARRAANVDGFAGWTPRTSTSRSPAPSPLPGLGHGRGRGRRLLQRRHLVDVVRRQRRTA